MPTPNNNPKGITKQERSVRAELRLFCSSLKSYGYPSGAKWLRKELEKIFTVIDTQRLELMELREQVSRFTGSDKK